MNTAHDDNTATSWRDLADQLTDQQQANLAHLEAQNTSAKMLLEFARDHIDARLTDIACNRQSVDGRQESR